MSYHIIARPPCSLIDAWAYWSEYGWVTDIEQATRYEHAAAFIAAPTAVSSGGLPVVILEAFRY